MAHDGVSSRRPLVSVTYTHNTLAGGVHFPVAPPDEVSWRQKNRRRIQYEYRKRRQGLRDQERDKGASTAVVIRRFGSRTNNWCKQCKSANRRRFASYGPISVPRRQLRFSGGRVPPSLGAQERADLQQVRRPVFPFQVV